MTKYIFITGGVVSSLGKGLTAGRPALRLEWDGARQYQCENGCTAHVSIHASAHGRLGFFLVPTGLFIPRWDRRPSSRCVFYRSGNQPIL